MNKEKFINKLNEELDELKGKELLYFNMRDSVQEARCTNRIFGIQYALNCARLLDEPQKVKVKPFVAEWFEENKHNLNFAIFELCEAGKAPVDLSEGLTDFEKWFYLNQDIETLVRMVDGYEVEESKWVVKRADSDYVTSFNQSLLNTNIDVTSSLDCVSYYKFTDLKKAEAVATLVDGSVEEV